MNSKIWLSSPHMGGDELKFIYDAFDSNWIAPLGPNVDGFEKSIREYLDEQVYVAGLNSGTAAIHLGLIILGVEKGDEVICQSLTFSASANPIIYQGATPVFVDSEADTWNICPVQLERAIKDRISKGSKPKAIVTVHLYGMPYKVDEVHAVAKKYGIPILEDSAEAFGSSYKGRKCGTFGDVAVLSFNGNKIITGSCGGALITKSIGHKERAVFLATQARDNAPHYQHSTIGFNYRMSNIVAGIGRGQMRVLDDRVRLRRRNYEFYQSHLKDIDEISVLGEPNGYFSNRWLTCIQTDSYEMRERIRMALETENVESRPIWKPMHRQPVFANCPAYLNGISDKLFEKGLCLPSGSNLTEYELSKVVRLIQKNYCNDKKSSEKDIA